MTIPEILNPARCAGRTYIEQWSIQLMDLQHIPTKSSLLESTSPERPHRRTFLIVSVSVPLEQDQNLDPENQSEYVPLE